MTNLHKDQQWQNVAKKKKVESGQVLWTFLLKNQIVNILDFVKHKVSNHNYSLHSLWEEYSHKQ